MTLGYPLWSVSRPFKCDRLGARFDMQGTAPEPICPAQLFVFLTVSRSPAAHACRMNGGGPIAAAINGPTMARSETKVVMLLGIRMAPFSFSSACSAGVRPCGISPCIHYSVRTGKGENFIAYEGFLFASHCHQCRRRLEWLL
jgi:hypothetical protein